MITPSHVIYSWAAARWLDDHHAASTHRRTTPFLLGAIAPDIPIYIFFIVYSLLLNYSGAILWNDMYFNSSWSIVFTLSHSLLVWPALATLGWYLKRTWLRYVSISAILHIGVDFLVHTSDAYQHFWPLTDWRFISPVSYWNETEYSAWVTAADSSLVLLVLTYLWYSYAKNNMIRLGIICSAGCYILIGIMTVI